MSLEIVLSWWRIGDRSLWRWRVVLRWFLVNFKLESKDIVLIWYDFWIWFKCFFLVFFVCVLIFIFVEVKVWVDVFMVSILVWIVMVFKVFGLDVEVVMVRFLVVCLCGVIIGVVKGFGVVGIMVLGFIMVFVLGI